jgi:ribosomal protein S18 acetylase RimI-like enzyme
VSNPRNVTQLQSRLYKPEDLAGVLSVFDSNIPEFFTRPEGAAFVEFLGKLPGPYYVVESGNSIVACGGYAIVPAESRADLCWGMVERGLHGRGIGRFLTELRIDAARSDPRVTSIVLNTSQHTQAFYERLGFVTQMFTKDAFAPGLHRCDMRMELR